jgi:hypothetical protein
LNKPKLVADAANTMEKPINKNTDHDNTDKTALTIALLATAISSHAQWVRGHLRGNGT